MPESVDEVVELSVKAASPGFKGVTVLEVASQAFGGGVCARGVSARAGAGSRVPGVEGEGSRGADKTRRGSAVGLGATWTRRERTRERNKASRRRKLAEQAALSSGPRGTGKRGVSASRGKGAHSSWRSEATARERGRP